MRIIAGTSLGFLKSCYLKLIGVLIVGTAAIFDANLDPSAVFHSIAFVNRMPAIIPVTIVAWIFARMTCANFLRNDFAGHQYGRRHQFIDKFEAASRDSVALDKDQRSLGLQNLQKLAGERETLVKQASTECIVLMIIGAIIFVTALLLLFKSGHQPAQLCYPMMCSAFVIGYAGGYLMYGGYVAHQISETDWPTKEQLSSALAHAVALREKHYDEQRIPAR